MTDSSSRCASCNALLAPGVRFCPECGRPTVRRPPFARLWIGGGLAGVVLVAVLLILPRLMKSRSGSNVTNADLRPPSGPSVVVAPSRNPGGPPLTGANPNGPGGPPVTQAPAVPADPNAAAVDAYLAKMAAIETRRKEIVNNLYPAMLSMALLKNMGGMQDMFAMLDENVDEERRAKMQPKSVQDAQTTMKQYRDQFRALAMDVQRIPPPLAAQRFKNGYVVSLAQYDSVIGEIEAAVTASDTSIGGKGGALKDRVTQTLKATDDEMQRLLDKFHLARRFTVSDDMGGSVMGGLGPGRTGTRAVTLTAVTFLGGRRLAPREAVAPGMTPLRAAPEESQSARWRHSR